MAWDRTTPENKAKKRDYDRKRRLDPKIRRRRDANSTAFMRQSKTGVSQELYESLYLAQNGQCAICNQHCSSLDADHCHHSGKTRGLLCRRCNLGLGSLNDSPDACIRAILYLQKPFTDIKWTTSTESRHSPRKYHQPIMAWWRQTEANLLEDQDGQCPILLSPDPGRCWVIDHDHRTGFVRGVLSHKANVALGLFNENISLLISASEYLTATIIGAA